MHCIVALEVILFLGYTNAVEKQTKGNAETVVICQTVDVPSGICRPAAYCFNQYDSTEQYTANQCQLTEKVTGICCPKESIRQSDLPALDIKYSLDKTNKAFEKTKEKQSNEKETPSETLVRRGLPAAPSSMVERGIRTFNERADQEAGLIDNGIFTKRGSAAFRHQEMRGGRGSVIRKLNRNGVLALEVSKSFTERANRDVGQSLRQVSLIGTPIEDICPVLEECPDATRFRTIDATCNNLQNPLWGRSDTGFVRLTPAVYDDGVSSFRRSVSGQPLPGARDISKVAAEDDEVPLQLETIMVMQYGQLISHEISLGAESRIDSDSQEGIQCCPEDSGELTPEELHPECAPIGISESDEHFADFSASSNCMNFVRNAPTVNADCTLAPREQTNVITSYIDGSFVYGSTSPLATSLRTFNDGLLKTETVNDEEFMPFQDPGGFCANEEEENQCFKTGDERSNQHPALMLVHLIWLREHNRIATELKALNPMADDETLYQESRRIVAAQLQHITYNEYLPIILGRKIMEYFGLFLKPSGFRFDYDPECNAAISAEFATVGFRLHSSVPGVFEMLNKRGGVTEDLRLRDYFDNPDPLYRKGSVEEFLRGITNEHLETMDPFFTDEITEYLFETRGEGFGLDLAAINIQRGRDHGMPSYNDMRELCGLKRIETFRELHDVLQDESAKVFSTLYESVDDIDAFIAGSHEIVLPGALVGPTFACLIGEQMRRTQRCDRYWYENGGLISSFTEEQLNEIRKVSLAGVICQNSAINFTHPLVLFEQSGDFNPLTSCDDIASIDLTCWDGI